MFFIHSYVDLQVTEQLRVQPEGLIAEEILQAASHKAWNKAFLNLVMSTTDIYSAVKIWKEILQSVKHTGLILLLKVKDCSQNLIHFPKGYNIVVMT